MKKLLLASAALALWCDAGWAQMPDARKPDFTSPANDWSGFYVGATAGAAWGQYAPRTSTVRGGYFGSLGAPAVTAAGMQTINATGFVAGLEGGYNWQIGNLLLGLEADLEAVDLNGSVSTGAIRYPTHPPEYTVTSYGSTDWLFTARPRLGWAMPNHWLLYATGGLAVTQLHSDFSFVDTNRVFVSGMDYFLTPAWSVGVGARYWAWNTSIGSVTFDFLTAPPPITEAARFTAERYGVFAQSSYRWGDPAAFASDHPIVGKAAVVASGPAHWTGFYVGGHLGGGWSDAQWSDPFASTAPLGFVNVAGFGDRTHATGPLGGGQIGGDWQMGRIVVGVEADADAANMHGENTCFSGLGGVNCQHVISALGAITGRVGFAWDRSLAYAKGGGAWTDTSYNVLGNTAALALGAGGTTLDRWGWTVGGGIEYALTNHWSALAEYDHVGISSADVPFPSVAVINTQQIGVRQSVNLFKLGVNYKFELAGLGTITAQ